MVALAQLARGRAARTAAAGDLRHQLHAPLERDELAAAQAVAEELRRVRRAAHAVEVRAGVGAADHHERVVPRLGAQLPRLRVVVGRQRPQHRAQVVVDHDVDAACRTCRWPRSFARSATTRPFRPSFAGGERVADHGSGPTTRGARTRRPRGSAPARPSTARTSGSRSFAMRSGTGRFITSDQPGIMNSAQ